MEFGSSYLRFVDSWLYLFGLEGFWLLFSIGYGSLVNGSLAL